MSKIGKDIEGLEEQARNSEHDESYYTIERSEHFKVGTGVRVDKKHTTHFMEVIIQLCSEGCTVDMELLDRKMEVIKEFSNSDYYLKCEDDSSVCCEKEIGKEEFERELSYVKEQLNKVEVK